MATKEPKIEEVKMPDFGQMDTNILTNDLSKVLPTHSTAPTHRPRKLIDCFYLYDDLTDKKLYLYISNTWVSITLT